jgi:tRNA (mo5U34)-methyltransferase
MSTETTGLTPDEIRRRAAEYEWYHTLDLGDGIVARGQYDLQPILRQYGIPDDLAGKTVLDVGPGHGFFAFELERRGATVTTTELPNWAEHDASPALQQEFARVGDLPEAYHRGAFGFAIQARRSQLTRCFCNVYDLTPERIGTYDLVFCASVLLHLTDPLRALFAMRKVCRDQAIICTGIDSTVAVQGQSRALFVGEVNGQAFWLPTVACLERMVLAAGFARVEHVATFRLKSVDGKFDTPHTTLRAFVS